MDYSFYQHYWWFLISLLGALLVFLTFVQGGQSLLYQIGKTDLERTMLINALGRKWEFTFTTLVTFGGAFFASFPLFYSTSFGGAYWAWMALLFCFIIQAVSYEFRSKKGNLLGKKTFDIFLFINGIGIFLLGVIVATMFTGSEFVVNKANLTNTAMPVISTWSNPLHGLEAMLNVRNILLGLAVLSLARILGELYFIQTINDVDIQARSRKALIWDTVFFLVFFKTFLLWTLLAKGFAVDPETQGISLVSAKYLNNLLEMPIVLILFLLGVLSVLFGILRTLFKPGFIQGIWFTGIGTVATVLALLLIAGWNHTAYYPSTSDLQSSLTIQNSSSSLFTLQVMSLVSLMIPFVLWYVFKAWKAINKKQIDANEMKGNDMKY
ncbi:MAG TPA: cytochrome d ubiquinol oxidase subunit II [Bacteroidales bacterium]|nr:cytochrome d ubiquinol oxidase subunit II [Bacteroidales bacterium]